MGEAVSLAVSAAVGKGSEAGAEPGRKCRTRCGNQGVKSLVCTLRRGLDLSLAVAGLLMGGPLLLALAALIRVNSSGPVLYWGLRAGRHGRSFFQAKLRTMIARADVQGGTCTTSSDPRITTVGSFLRRWKLDELPQLWNVVKGEMGLVGPRPEVERYAALLKAEERRILSVRPGITDWATLWNADEEAFLARQSVPPEVAYEKWIRPVKVRLQLEYVRTRSLGTDLLILWLTLRRLCGARRRPRALARLLDTLRAEGLAVPDLDAPEGVGTAPVEA